MGRRDDAVRIGVFALLFGLVVGFGVLPGIVSDDVAEPGASPPSADLVSVGQTDGNLWPYTSRARAADQRTLAINLVVYGDPDVVRGYLLRRADLNWSQQPAPSLPTNDSGDPLADIGASTPWREAHGATRYTYVETNPEVGGGVWLDESYQIYDGTYLGTREHIRAYESPDPEGNWTAMQVHQEYWDWFRLRHTVTGITDPQRNVERDFMDDWFVDRVWRRYLDNGGTSDGNGWATIVEFGVAFAAAGVVGSTRAWTNAAWSRVRETFDGHTGARSRGTLLLVSIAAVYVGVRVGAVAVEELLPGVSPKLIAGAFYPILAVGLPLCAYRFGRSVEIEWAFVLAPAGLLVALLFDHAYLDLAAIPIELLLYRVPLMLSLGLLAAGGAYRARDGTGWNELLQFGVAGWVLGLLLPLLGLV